MILARRPRLFARPPLLPRGSAPTRAGRADSRYGSIYGNEPR